MGCAVACVASLLSISYQDALSLFSHPARASTKGFYCRDIIAALARKRVSYTYKKYVGNTIKDGTIVFFHRSNSYPLGHYLLKTRRGWMNPWINYPTITSAKAGFQKRLPGKAQWIINPMN